MKMIGRRKGTSDFRNKPGFWLTAYFLVCLNLSTCLAGTSPATQLISGIWSEEGCIVPQEDRTRKLWGVATLWLLENPVDPCNSPCGCPPEGLNPALVVKPGRNPVSDGGGAAIIVSPPVIVGIDQLPVLNRPVAPPPQRFPPSVVGGLPPGCIYAPGYGILNATAAPFLPPVPQPPRIVPPFVGPPLPYPPIVPPFVGPPLPHPPFLGPFPLPPLLPPPHFVGPFPPFRPPTVPVPILKPVFNKVPIDFGFSQVIPPAPISASLTGDASIGATSITTSDHDKTHLNVNFDSDKGSKNTVTSTTGTIATSLPLIVSPPQPATTGSTTVTSEDWDKEKFNANYDKDKGSKQTVTTTGGNAAVIAAPVVPCQLTTPTQVVANAGSTTVTQEDWDKEKLNANYDKDKGSKQTVTTTGGTAAVPGQTILVPAQAAIAGSTTVTSEDWDKEKFNANYDKDKGNKQTVTTTGGNIGLVAAPEPCLCTTGTNPLLVNAGTTTVSQQDWDKQHLNLNYDKDQGSRSNVTTTLGGGGIFVSPLGPPPSLYGQVGHLPAPPVLGPAVYPPGPFIPFEPLGFHHPPFFGPPPFVGPSVPFLPNGGVLPIPPPVPTHNFGPFGPPPPLNPIEFRPPHSAIVPTEGFPPRPLPVPSHHGLPSLISKLPVVGPILQHVIIDFGDNPANAHLPLDRPGAPLDLPGPSILTPPSPDISQPSTTPGRVPSLISKIPIVGPIIGHYFESTPVSADNAPIGPSPSTLGPLFHTVPIQFGTSPLPQPINPEIPLAPAGSLVPSPSITLPATVFPPPPPPPSGSLYPPPPPTGPAVLPAEIPHDVPPPAPLPILVGTLPANVPPQFPPPPYYGNFHYDPVIVGVGVAPHQNLPPPPGLGPVYLPQYPPYNTGLPPFGQRPPIGSPPHLVPPISGVHTVPIDFGLSHPPQNPALLPPSSLGSQPIVSPSHLAPTSTISGLLTVPIDFGLRPPPQNPSLFPPPALGPQPGGVLPVSDLRPPPSLGPLPSGPPPSLGPLPNLVPPQITELRPPPSLGSRPQGPPSDLDFLPKDPSSSYQPILRPPVVDPGLIVSNRNPNVVVNRFGGGVVLPGSPQPYKCRSKSGRCNHSRDIKDFKEGISSEANHLRSEDPAENPLKEVTEETQSSPETPTLQSL